MVRYSRPANDLQEEAMSLTPEQERDIAAIQKERDRALVGQGCVKVLMWLVIPLIAFCSGYMIGFLDGADHVMKKVDEAFEKAHNRH